MVRSPEDGVFDAALCALRTGDPALRTDPLTVQGARVRTEMFTSALTDTGIFGKLSLQFPEEQVFAHTAASRFIEHEIDDEQNAFFWAQAHPFFLVFPNAKDRYITSVVRTATQLRTMQALVLENAVKLQQVSHTSLAVYGTLLASSSAFVDWQLSLVGWKTNKFRVWPEAKETTEWLALWQHRINFARTQSDALALPVSGEIHHV